MNQVETDAIVLGTVLIADKGTDALIEAVPDTEDVTDTIATLAGLLSACLITTCLDQGLDPQQVWSQFALHQATERPT